MRMATRSISGWRHQRNKHIESVVKTLAPDVVIVETYPFGRGLIRAEIEQMLTLVKRILPRTLRLSSFRDILEPRRDFERYEKMCKRAKMWFNGILIHTDPRYVDFAETFPLAAELADRIHHTGFVRPNVDIASKPDTSENYDVIVSAGGGRVGLTLLQTAIKARSLSRCVCDNWLILVGSQIDEESFQTLQRLAREVGNGAIAVQRNRADFGALLARAKLSISQAGYNTVIDVLSANVAAVFVPYATDGAQEQTLRATALASRGLGTCLSEEALTAQTLAHAIDRATASSSAPRRPSSPAIMLDGAQRSAEIIESLLKARE